VDHRDDLLPTVTLICSSASPSTPSRRARAPPRATRVVARYDVQAAVPQIRCPVLLIGATADTYGYPALARLRAVLPDARVEEIEGGMVPLPDQFAAAVERFLDHLQLDEPAA